MKSRIFNVAWVIYGQGGRLIFQTVYYFLLAIILAPKQYGMYVTITSLIVILSPFCGVGFNSLIVKILSTDKNSFSRAFGNTIKITFYSYFILLLLGEVIIHFLYPNQFEVNVFFLTLSLADLLFIKLNEMSAQIFIAKNNVKISANIQTFISFTRFISVVILYLNKSGNIITWSILYFTISLLFTIFVFIYTLIKCEKPNLKHRISKSYVKEGIFFSIGLSSQGVYNDIDKTILGKFDSFQQTGYYGFAYKMLDVVFIPIKAILLLTFPKFFKIGNSAGIKGSFGLAKKILLPLLIYSLVACIVSFFSAPILLSQFNGGKYASSLNYFDLLLIIVVLRSIHYVLSDSLTGAGYQRERSIVQVLVAIINLILNIIFIRYYKVYGAIAVSIFSDTLLAICIIWLVKSKMKKELSRVE